MSEDAIRDRVVRACWPVVGAALEEAAAACLEGGEGWCRDCEESSSGLCDTHREDRDRAEEYRRTADELRAVLGG